MVKSKAEKISGSLSLNKKQVGFVDKISRDARFPKGRKLSRSAIIRALLSIAQGLETNVDGVKDERELEKRFLEAFEKCK